MSDLPHASYDRNHLNITLPTRCQRCHAFKRSTRPPSPSQSFSIVLSKVARSHLGRTFVLSVVVLLGVTVLSWIPFLWFGVTGTIPFDFWILYYLFVFILLFSAEKCCHGKASAARVSFTPNVDCLLTSIENRRKAK